MASRQSTGITRHHVERAAEKWARNPGYGGFGNAKRYEVVIKGRAFPIKAIVAIAQELAGKDLPGPYDFPGRRDGKWHRVLQDLGFEVRERSEGPPADAAGTPIPVTTAELLEEIVDLGASFVITRNKNADWRGHFRVNSRNPDQWLDGYWPGEPTEVKAGRAFVAHVVAAENLVWIGRYLGTVPNGAKNSLVLDMVTCVRITDAPGNTEEHKMLNRILRQPGPVTYSYYHPTEGGGEIVTEARFRKVRQRLEQSAFRKAVLAHHGGRCVVTGCSVDKLLEAAHLPGRDWRVGHNAVGDGIPLRADLHRALDANLIRLDAAHRLVWVHADLEEMYGHFLARRQRSDR